MIILSTNLDNVVKIESSSSIKSYYYTTKTKQHYDYVSKISRKISV